MKIKINHEIRNECERFVKIVEIIGVKPKSELRDEYLKDINSFWGIPKGIRFNHPEVKDWNEGEIKIEGGFEFDLEILRKGAKKLAEIKEKERVKNAEWIEKGEEVLVI